MTVATDAELESLDWENVEPCAANNESCAHDAVSIVRFIQHEHAIGTPNQWWPACQTHLDRIRAGRTHCPGCKGRLVLLDVQYL